MSRPTRFYSKLQEQKVAKAVNGKRTANSGATPFSKGDVTTDLFLLECKTCTSPKQSFSLKKEWFDKNKEEAFAMHKDFSAVVFDFGDDDRHYVIDETTFQLFLSLLKESYDD